MNRFVGARAAALAALSILAAAPAAHAGEPMVAKDGRTTFAATDAGPRAGAPGGPGLALRAAKVLTAAVEGPEVVDDGVVLVRDGKIEAVGPARTTEVPDGYERMDVGLRWLMPGLIDLHTHIAGTFDINDGVYLTNPGLRAYTSVVPDNPMLERAVAAGVTSILFIPGSGTNISGWGVLLKTGFKHYEQMEIRNPGCLKLAQSGNPERYTIGVRRTFMNWNTRDTLRRGMAYARRWEAFEKGEGPEPERNIQFDIFRYLLSKETQVATHTQMFQVVNETLSMVREEFGLDVYIDHGTFDGYLAAERAEKLGVPAILGPRSIEVPSRLWIRFVGVNTDGRIQGVVEGYQKRGHTRIGFNTDAPVIPAEELIVQASVAVHYGMDDHDMGTVRGLTIVPAQAAGIDDRVGSLEVGKDADILVIGGSPADPRSVVDTVYIEGERVYDYQEAGRTW